MIMPYIINVALILGACLVFYKLLFRRETFYKINRWLLVVCLLISFALPLLQVPQEFSLRKMSGERSVVSGGPSIGNGEWTKNGQQPATDIKQSANNTQKQVTSAQQAETKNDKPKTINNKQPGPAFSFAQLMNWAIWIYWFGVSVFSASFLFQLLILLYRAYHNPVIIDGKYRIVEVSGDKAPCSFGNTIFINPSIYDWDTYNQILLHEKIHIRQKHTADIIIAELMLIFQWFNPFAWIYRREIEYNLEFLTDDQLVQGKEVDKKSYQLSLVKVTAPHLPLSLTTNYNQSILKKRIAMMNRKKSNLHTAWKYFFMLPVLALLVCLLNEPLSAKQTDNRKNTKNTENAKQTDNGKNAKQAANTKNANKNANGANVHQRGIETEGYWFAIIKDDKVNIRFSDEKIVDEEFKGNSYSGTTFKLSELGNIPKGTPGTFTITREAGKMEFTGKFDGNTGMGSYKFIADKTYSAYMSKELNEKLDDEDEMSFFFVNVTKDYLQTLRNEGFTKLDKDDIISMSALKVDAAFIKSIKNAGFKDVNTEHLVSFKALGVDDKYITEIRSAGYKDISEEQIISFKAQGIDKEYITKVRQLKGDKSEKGEKGDKGDKDDDADDIISFKAMGIDEAFINSFKAVGLTNIPNEQLVSFKAVGVTPEYIKSWHALGFKDIDPEEFVGMKSQDVTPEYMKSFTDMGYKNIEPENLVSFKALGITPEWIRSFEAVGYKNIDMEELTGLKAQGITPEYIKSFEAVGFKNIKIEEIVSVKAVGVTPEYIKDMKSKGFDYNRLEKYVRLKTID